MKNILFKSSLFLMILVFSSVNIAYGLSPEQKRVMDSGILYFDVNKNSCETGLGSAPGTGPCMEALLPNILDGDGLATAIDTYIHQTVPGSPLENLGNEFVKSGVQYGINPMYVVALAQKESSLGTKGIATNGGHNSFGRKAGSGQPSLGGFYDWPSWKDSVSTAHDDNQFAFLKRVYIDEGFNTIAKIREKYCPNSDSCAANYTEVVGGAMVKMVELAGSSLGCGDSSYTTAEPAGTTQSTATAQIDATYVGDANAFADSGGPITPTAIVLHYTAIAGNVSAVDLVSSMKNNTVTDEYPKGRVVQLYVRRDGSAYQLTKLLEARPTQTLPGGPSNPWNDVSIGVEIEGLTEDELLGNTAQFFGVIGLVKQLMAKYNIQNVADLTNRKGIVGHYEINPNDRTDPGETFMARVRSTLQNGTTIDPGSGTVTGDCGNDGSGNITLPGYPEVITPQESCTKLEGYDDKLKASTKNLCNAVQQSFAGMSAYKNVGNCWRAEGSTSTSDHPQGLACDFSITPNSDPTGYSLVEWAIKYKDPLKIKYVIFDDRIWTSSGGFKERDYVHSGCKGAPLSNCSDNLRHLNHVHISVNE